MASIKIHNDPAKNLTTLVVSGNVTVDQILSALEEFYGKSTTSNALWDLSLANLSDLTADKLEKILSSGIEYARSTKVGKRALVASHDLEFGISRMYQNLSVLYEHPASFGVFRTHDEAMRWLFADDEPAS